MSVCDYETAVLVLGDKKREEKVELERILFSDLLFVLF